MCLESLDRVYLIFFLPFSLPDDAWQFNTQKKKWTKVSHPHKDKPR